MGVPAFQKGEDEWSLDTNWISLSYYLFNKKNIFLEINLHGERIRIYKRKGNDKERELKWK